MASDFTYIVGIDEAGRGPLAGPVAVGVSLIPVGFDWDIIPGVTDSKKLSEKKREEVFKNANHLQNENMIQFAVSMVGADVIDRIGIVPSITRAMSRALTQLKVDPENVFVKLDGSLHAPLPYVNQETYIKGDALYREIGLASILAKVTRDRYMVRASKRIPEYQFEAHKGYGTAVHRALIQKHGLSPLHRKTFCRGCVTE